MKIRPHGRHILARVLPKDIKSAGKSGTKVYLPPNRSVGTATARGTFEPVKVRALALGPLVQSIRVGMTLVLNAFELEYVGDDLVIVPETLYGSYYDRFNNYRRFTDGEIKRLTKADDDRCVEGHIMYVED